MVYHKNEKGEWVTTIKTGLKGGRQLYQCLELVAKPYTNFVTIIREGPKPNSYVLDSAYFMKHFVVTDGWEKFKIIGRPLAFPIEDEPYGMFWLYTFDKSIREPINCKLWKTN